MPDRYTLLYHSSSNFSLIKARELFAARENWVVNEVEDGFTIQWHDGPVLTVRAGQIADVRTRIEHYNNALDVWVPDLDAALDEINTLIESQHVLAMASNGAVYTHWNENLQTEFQ